MYCIPNYLISDFIKTVGNRRNSQFIKEFPNKNISNQNDIIDACKKFYNLNTIWRGAKGTRECRKYNLENYNRLLKKGFILNQYSLNIEKEYNCQVNIALENIAIKIWKYFNFEPNTQNNQICFDSFHCDLCTSFINDLHVARSKLPYDDISYGQAQKFVNVIFKYLTCFGDYNSFADLFSYCHIAIDTNVLWALEHWLKVPNIKSNYYVTNGRPLFSARYNNVTWTSLDQKSYDSLVRDYRGALNSITMGKESNLTFEYSVWNSLRNSPIPTTFSGFPTNNRITVKLISCFYM